MRSIIKISDIVGGFSHGKNVFFFYLTNAHTYLLCACVYIKIIFPFVKNRTDYFVRPKDAREGTRPAVVDVAVVSRGMTAPLLCVPLLVP